MRCAFLSLLAALVLTDMASAQSWPSRPVRMIVPQAAGGIADILARVISSPLSRELGQQVIVDNRAGDGTAGAQAAARAAADGYTYLFGTAPVLVINPYMAKILPYSPEDDFAQRRDGRLDPAALIAGRAERQYARAVHRARKGQPRQARLCEPRPEDLRRNARRNVQDPRGHQPAAGSLQ
jgi:tripartite-type tricarboxylate transporter receptor subunit TctC